MKVIILRDREFDETHVFSSEEKFLEYLRYYYPKAKNLRVWRNSWGGNLTAYNHNTPIYGWGYTLKEIEVDREVRKQIEREEEFRKEIERGESR
ncbi:hypothetical protein LCGC14_0869420 [marine sediment metagenome]|uniref:Uncharacterized protein n=1 Tax=marine sediment metagenome TaxID=412755 RepID=A0A0F9RPQ5_9ZZZZ